jgi:4-amino-4-deoxy-L-arabinose transferase-like glycosyltransferase
LTRFTRLLALGIAVAGVSLWWAWSPPTANELVSGDEGYYGVMGRNILVDARYLVSPSLWPEGQAGDKPPVYPALLAISMKLLGPNETGVRAPSFLFALLTALGVAFLLFRAAGPWAGVGGVALLVTLPWFADASRGAAAEIPTTAFGTLALSVAAANPASRTRATVAGALIGLAFLCKLWLVAPFALACLSIYAWRSESRPTLGWVLLGALPVAAAHGVAVMIFARSDVVHWLQIYFGRSLFERTSGAGYVGGWVKHPLYYWAILVHATALVFPLAVAGIEAGLRRWREGVNRSILVWAACVGLLSAFAVKTGIYV